MLMNRLLQRVASFTSQVNVSSTRNVHSTLPSCAGARYRESKNQERHMNRHREFADTPDWSYLDGRPAPLIGGQRKRYEQQMDYNRTIQTLLQQVDYAKETQAAKLTEQQANKDHLIKNKLRCKGKQLYLAEKKQLAKMRTN